MTPCARKLPWLGDTVAETTRTPSSRVVAFEQHLVVELIGPAFRVSIFLDPSRDDGGFAVVYDPTPAPADLADTQYPHPGDR